MKTIRIFLTLVLTLACYTAQAQCPNTNDSIREKAIADSAVEAPLADALPTYPGGNAALLTFVAKNLEYPIKAQEQKVQGVVLLKFVVGADGPVSNIKIEKSLSPECDRAAANVIKKLQRFTPAKRNGRPIAVWLRLPIRFRIQ